MKKKAPAYVTVWPVSFRALSKIERDHKGRHREQGKEGGIFSSRFFSSFDRQHDMVDEKRCRLFCVIFSTVYEQLMAATALGKLTGLLFEKPDKKFFRT